MQNPSVQHRLRIKLPSGAEFEAEGTAEFVAAERREFLGDQEPAKGKSAEAADSSHLAARPLEPNWTEVIETHGPNIQLRAKLKGGGTERDACLVLLAASQRVLRLRKPTAAQIARWMRLSGYPIPRVDRMIQTAIESGEILASGSRRGRRYELSGPGIAKAFNIALRLGPNFKPPKTLPAHTEQ